MKSLCSSSDVRNLIVWLSSFKNPDLLTGFSDSIFYENYYIFESIVLELKKLIYLSTGIETIFTNKTDSGYFELYEKGILSILHNQPYINYYQYLEYRQEEPFIIDNQVIMKGYKNAEEFSNSITVLLVLMKNLYDQLLKKVPQDKL